MKNSFILVLLLPFFANAQEIVFPVDSMTNLVTYNLTAKVPETSQNDLFDRAKSWYDQQASSGQLHAVQQEKKTGIVSGKKTIIRTYSYNTLDTVPIRYEVEFTVKLVVQNNLYSVTLTDYKTKTAILDITSIAPMEEIFSINRPKKKKGSPLNKDEQETLRIRNDLTRIIDESSKDCLTNIRTAMAQ